VTGQPGHDEALNAALGAFGLSCAVGL